MNLRRAMSCVLASALLCAQPGYAVQPQAAQPHAEWTAEANQPGARFGTALATAGDVNGDGYADVIAGARGYDTTHTNGGRVFVYHGSGGGLSLVADWTAEGDQVNGYLGIAAATAGDVNADGYDDVIVGAYGYDNGQMNEGRAYVYHGSAAGLSLTPDWTAESDQVLANFGVSVSAAGDVNNDGYDDVIVGTQGYDNGQVDEGRAYVFHGSATGLSLTPTWTAEADQAAAFFGLAVSGAGDVNNDGYADVIVGALAYDDDQVDEGRAYVYHGSATGLSLTPDWTAEGDQPGAGMGGAVGRAGDVNADGYDDVIVGVDSYNTSAADAGRVVVVHGSATGLSLTPDWQAESQQAAAAFGFAVSPAGDTNGDGYSDVMIGAPYYNATLRDEGAAYVYLGSVSGLGAWPGWTTFGMQLDASLGFALGTAGDVKDDGMADVVVGAELYDNGEVDEGRGWGYYSPLAAAGRIYVPLISRNQP